MRYDGNLMICGALFPFIPKMLTVIQPSILGSQAFWVNGLITSIMDLEKDVNKLPSD